MGLLDFLESVKDEVAYRAEQVYYGIDDKVSDIKDYLEEHEVGDKLKEAGKTAFEISKELFIMSANAASEQRMQNDPEYAARMARQSMIQERKSLIAEMKILKEKCENSELTPNERSDIEYEIKERERRICELASEINGGWKN